jgi:hypothetical protein
MLVPKDEDDDWLTDWHDWQYSIHSIGRKACPSSVIPLGQPTLEKAEKPEIHNIHSSFSLKENKNTQTLTLCRSILLVVTKCGRIDLWKSIIL